MLNPILAAGEPLIGLAEAGRPTNTHPATVSRWASRGILRDGRRVKLECVRVGAKLKTSAEAVRRFFSALSGETTAAAPLVPTPAERRRAALAAEQELIAAGA